MAPPSIRLLARLIDSKIDLESLALVSGIGCTGRVAGYVKLDSFHTTHGRAIPFATGLKLANPQAQRRGVFGRRRSLGDWRQPPDPCSTPQHRSESHLREQSDLRHDRRPDSADDAGARDHSTNPYGTFEPAFNLPHLVEAAGAVYVARWTTFHVRQLSRSISEAFQKKGFSFIEVISPCPTLYQRRNKMGDGLDTMKYYKEKSKVKNGAPTSEVGLTLNGEIAVGKFVDRDRPDYQSMMRAQYVESLGERYIEEPEDGVRMRLTEIRIAGFGGQGVILSAVVLGKAASIYENGFATMTQNFGPEARGGACSAQLVVSDSPVLYPYVTQPDIMVVMSQEAYNRFAPELKPRRHADRGRGPGTRLGSQWRHARSTAFPRLASPKNLASAWC